MAFVIIGLIGAALVTLSIAMDIFDDEIEMLRRPRLPVPGYSKRELRRITAGVIRRDRRRPRYGIRA